jgi:hypothetical protein
MAWNGVILRFIEEMLLIAKLMYETDLFFVERLNGMLEEFGLEKVFHVVHAIYRLGDKYRSRE